MTLAVNGTELLGSRIAKVRAAFASGRTRPVAYRRQQLQALRRLVDENQARICEAVAKDLHKSDVDATLTEIALILNEVDDCLANLNKWVKPKTVNTNVFNLPGNSEIVPEPYGVALIIGCWNYPVQLTLMPVAAALAAGNAVVIKPGSEDHSPASAALIAELVPKYMDQEAVIAIPGDYGVLQELLSMRWDVIMATGSPALGRMVAKAAGGHLTPVLLELGGKSPAYVHRDTDVEVAARRIAWAAYMNAGQTCIRPDHVFVDCEIADRFITAVTRATKEMYGEDPKQSEWFGRLANQRSLDRLKAMVKADQKFVLWGGESDDRQTYLAPTLLDFNRDQEAFEHSACMQDEIFGPIIPVVRVNGPDDAIKSILTREKPLSLYVFTADWRLQQRFVAETSSGAVVFNDCIVHVSNSDLPFGGVGNSGMGVYHGKYGFDAFSHAKPVLTRGTAMDISARYPPYTDAKRKLLMGAVNYIPGPVVTLLNVLLSPVTWSVTVLAGSAAFLFARSTRA